MTLTYVDPSPPGGLGAASGTTFTINQSRRIKFYERNYYDHPAFGVIALVSPAQGDRDHRVVERARARNGLNVFEASLLKVRRLGGRDAVLPQRLRALQRRSAGFQQRIERELARRHQARHSRTQCHEAARAGTRVMHQQITDALRDHLRILRGFLRGVALCQDGERARLPNDQQDRRPADRTRQ